MPRLAVVALISGGKDSLFSILHCIANGHDVVALANLHPPIRSDEDAVDDMDSYMYQTIGHTVIPLYAQALGLPLYRQEIAGTAINQKKSYGPDTESTAGNEDETESLLPLLRHVKAAHPEVNAVSTGAILSDYQRTRVESVARRLGFTPLSFLWQWPSLPPQSEASLLENMASIGQDSRIIKVASGGLDDSFLWQNVAEPRTVARLTKAAQRFGLPGDGALLGEGGEYETLAIDGPSYLWKARIEVEGAHRQILQGEAGSSSLRLLQARLIPKDTSDLQPSSLRTPPLWDPSFEVLIEELNQKSSPTSIAKGRHLLTPGTSVNITAVSAGGDVVLLPDLTGLGESSSEQMHAIMGEAISRLAALGHCIDDIAYTSIIMRDMADFPAINAIYGRFFTEPNPPARVTIACADVLPSHAQLGVALTSVRSPANLRRGLHVQSQSYWAPANIGPYSQAISVPLVPGDGDAASDVVFIAGQIPLTPASMELGFPIVEGESATFYLYRQSALALQHLHRIGRVTGVERWASVIAFIVARDQKDLDDLAYGARQLWTTYHRRPDESSSDNEDDENFDVWHATHRPTWDRIQSAATSHSLSASANTDIPPIYVVRVDALPRGASIEWVGYGLTSGAKTKPSIPHMEYLLEAFKHRIV